MKIYRVLRAALLVSAALTVQMVSADTTRLCEVDPTHAPATSGKPVQGDTPSPVVVPVTALSASPRKAPSAPGPDTSGPGPASGPSPAPTQVPSPTTGATGPATPAATTSAAAPVSGGGAQQTSPGQSKAAFSYKGGDGGRPGSYDMVTDFATCAKQSHQTTSAVSPLDDDVTVSFRGPMTIHNIAVFDGSSGSWQKVSSFAKGGSTENMVFMNNLNIDYNGKSSAQGLSTSDGNGVAKQPQNFSGELGGATNPTGGFLPFEKTGTEVNIFTTKVCGQGTECKGYYDKDGTALKGWDGGKKIFITKVHMPHGSTPNLPAVWMLNGQVVRANQYGCNCRGMGKVGGCGELDIAEVIEKDANVVATHYYFYNGVPSPGHDSWGKCPVEGPTTYVTIIDESYGVKVVELGANDFDFQSSSIAKDVVSQWLSL